MDRFFCVHGHFYQPPREDPFTGQVPREPGAEPYNNYNEKITAECYAPNAQVGNFGRISFNLGGTLAAWLSRMAPDTYNRIVASDRATFVMQGQGNAIAQSVHHTILPLANERDKLTQVLWGIASFRYRFGRDPLGMWLPEMAVDHATLQVLAEQGIQYTILSPEQIATPIYSSGPYRVRLDNRRTIAVFVRDASLSNSISFDMDHYGGGAQGWAQANLASIHHDGGGGLTLIASDGETFGHHHRTGVEFLRQLLAHEVSRIGYKVTTLNRLLVDHPPHFEVEVRDNTSWSCGHGLARWDTGCSCTEGSSEWKGSLRKAFQTLSDRLDEIYEETASTMLRNAWRARDAFIQVVLGILRGQEFVTAHARRALTTAQTRRALLMLWAQVYRQRMYTSCAYFFEDLSRPEPRYAIANAARAIELTQRAVQLDLLPDFRRDLAVARSGRTGQTGADLLDEIIANAQETVGV